jgi:hypothetical protein
MAGMSSARAMEPAANTSAEASNAAGMPAVAICEILISHFSW